MKRFYEVMMMDNSIKVVYATNADEALLAVYGFSKGVSVLYNGVRWL